jgi:hypothetical protein
MQNPTIDEYSEKTGGAYSLDLFPDTNSLSIIQGLGLRNKPKLGDGGKLYFSFKAPVKNQYTGEVYEKPTVDMEDGTPYPDLIGNGSEITVKLLVESGTSKQFGKWTRSRVLGIRIHNLIKYEKPTADAAVATGTAPAASPQPATPAGGMPW